ncbi:MAG TPA: HAMP domain-containing sensor histidine kinase [Longimicrobiales bacterium]|nr:HAMP domain-containing sensor histidine kinase [Longimicrobiales bacterium]
MELLQDYERRFEQLRKLTEISRALTYTTALDQVLRLAVERAAELLEVEQAILLLTDAHGLLHIEAALGFDEQLVQRFREPLDELLLPRLPRLLGAGVDGLLMGVPLVVHEEVIGLLAVVRVEGKPVTDADEWLLSALADQAAVAIENARLSGQIHLALQQNTSQMDSAAMLRERALATLSHDLRSPLNAMDCYVELLELELYGPVTDRQREVLGRVRMSGRHLLSVLTNVMEMARLNAGVVRVATSDLALAPIAEEAVGIIVPAAAAKAQSLDVNVPPELIIRADPDLLRQVLVNLLANAVKYTPARGSLRLDAGGQERAGVACAAINVSDTGAGIPADKHETVFEPYERLPATATETGSGLGLAIARDLVRRMGGDITVESELGIGSKFTVWLPLGA